MFSCIILFSSINLYNIANVNATISGSEWVENQEIIYPYKDAFVFKNESNRNYGNNENFIVGNLTDFNLANGTGVDFCEAFFFFNLRQILSLERISSIAFSFYGESKNNRKISIEVYIVNALWDELTITWNNKPAISSFVDIIKVDVLKLYEINITQEALSKNSISISLRAPSSSEYFQGYTNESSNPYKPRIFLNYLEEVIIGDGTDLDFLTILLIGALLIVVAVFVISLISGRMKPKQIKKRRKKVKPIAVSGLQSKLVSLQSEIMQLKSLQDDLLLQAKQAERDRKYQLASELYGKCKGIALKLFKYGVRGQSDLIKKFTTLENKLVINQEFGQLGQMLDGITGEQFSTKLQAIMDLIVARKGKSTIIQNLQRWIDDYQTKSNILSEFDKRQIEKAIDFWKQF